MFKMAAGFLFALQLFLMHSGAAFASVTFACTKAKSPLQCDFRIQADNRGPEENFSVLPGGAKTMGDEYLGRKYCYGLEQIPMPWETPKKPEVDESLCGYQDVEIERNNYDSHRYPPVPTGSTIFHCDWGIIGGNPTKKCEFTFSDGSPSIYINAAMELQLSTDTLQGAQFCSRLVQIESSQHSTFEDCKNSKAWLALTLVRPRNSLTGVNFDEYNSPPAPAPESNLIPDTIYASPGNVSSCVLYDPPSTEPFYFMTGEIRSSSALLYPFFGIARKAEVDKFTAMCAGKWQVGQRGTDLKKIPDPKIPIREDLDASVAADIKRYEIAKNGYYLHVQARGKLYGVYAELYWEAKVTKTPDPEGEPLVVDMLNLVWVSNHSSGMKRCGRSSICAQSDRIYITSILGPIEMCARGISVISGEPLVADTERPGLCEHK